MWQLQLQRANLPNNLPLKNVAHCNPGKCRYCGDHIATSLTLPLRKKPGAQLAVRLCQYLRPKVHPLLLDSTINSPQTVRLNVYQVCGAVCLSCGAQGCVACIPVPDAEWLACMHAPATSTRVLFNSLIRSWRAPLKHVFASSQSREPVYLSQAFLLAAMKFHFYVKALPAAPAAGAGVLLEAILSGALPLTLLLLLQA